MDESFNEDFCGYLEYQLGAVFEQSDDEDIKSLWCDGIAMPPFEQLDRKHVNDTRRIITRTWIGKTGQDEYAMTIKLGKYSLRRYAKMRSMIDCIPSPDADTWVVIDIENRTIELNFR